jgi:hypothetical protein
MPKNACLRQSKAFKQHFNALEMYLLSFKVNFRVIFGVQKLFFGLECQRFAFFVTKTIRFLTFNFLNSKLLFVLFGLRYFLVVFERIFFFHFDHSDVRIKQIVSELKIMPQKRIGFMHVDITSYTPLT